MPISTDEAGARLAAAMTPEGRESFLDPPPDEWWTEIGGLIQWILANPGP